MRNRSYIGDGVYASFDGINVVLELEQGRAIFLNKDNWSALLTFMATHEIALDGCRVMSVPTEVFPDVIAALDTLNKDMEQIQPTKN